LSDGNLSDGNLSDGNLSDSNLPILFILFTWCRFADRKKN
jgi:hypothetical protein